MDTAVVVALLALAGSIGAAVIAVLGRRADNSTTAPDRAVTRLGAALDRLEVENARLDREADEARAARDTALKQRDDAVAAAAHALTRLGVVEAYVHQLETEHGLPHRDWQADLDTFPELQDRESHDPNR